MKNTQTQMDIITYYENIQGEISDIQDQDLMVAELPLEERNALTHALDLLFGERDDLRQEYLEVLNGS